MYTRTDIKGVLVKCLLNSEGVQQARWVYALYYNNTDLYICHHELIYIIIDFKCCNNFLCSQNVFLPQYNGIFFSTDSFPNNNSTCDYASGSHCQH